MRKTLLWWTQLRSSLWFLPTLIVSASVLLAAGMVELDAWIGMEMGQALPRLFGAGAEGSRGMLEAIAGSMITVAGVVFSITIVTLSLAASQYSSRVLRNFMRDRGNQAVLGVFLGVFAYCLIVLRTIRGGDENAFVPSIAVLAAVVLAFVGIGFLIYFIHHISSSIQATQILAAISADSLQALDQLFPQKLGVGDQDEDEPSGIGHALKQNEWHLVPARKTGYIVGVDNDAILRFACEREAIVHMVRGIGDFVIEGEPLAQIATPSRVDDRMWEDLNGCYSIGRQRTVEQDAAFGVRQIVDIALKALSPGINDLTTARMSLDHLSAILVRLAPRRIPSPFRLHMGHLRLVARGPTFSSLVHEAFDEIRNSAEGNVSMLGHLLARLESIAGMTDAPHRLNVLREQLEAIRETVRRSVPEGRDRHALELCMQQCARQLAERTRASVGPEGKGDNRPISMSNRD